MSNTNRLSSLVFFFVLLMFLVGSVDANYDNEHKKCFNDCVPAACFTCMDLSFKLTNAGKCNEARQISGPDGTGCCF